MAVKMRLIGGEWGVKMAPENGGTGTTLARSRVSAVTADRAAAPARIPGIKATTVFRPISERHPL